MSDPLQTKRLRENYFKENGVLERYGVFRRLGSARGALVTFEHVQVAIVCHVTITVHTNDTIDNCVAIERCHDDALCIAAARGSANTHVLVSI